MMDITRGSLDDITRPARSSRHRPGSRVSLNSFGGLSSPTSRPVSVTSSSLEILPPDPDILLQQDNDLSLVEYLSSDDEEKSTDHMNGDLQEERGRREGAEVNSEDDDVDLDRGAALIQGMQDRMRKLDLVLGTTDDKEPTGDFGYPAYGTQGEARSTSPECRPSGSPDEGISRSLTRELDAAGRRRGGEENGDEEEAEGDDLAGVTDPELRKALRKMRKLDGILNAKVTREREVKRQRKLLHHQLEEELDAIREEGGGRSKEATENTSRYLALVPPPRHDEGVNMEGIPSTPVFATQVPESSTSSSNEHSTPERKAGRQGRKQSKTSPREGTNQRRPRPPKKGGSQGANADNSDFIQRNIELASDAGNLIAMTDDEKKRLEDLLQDVDILAGDPDDESVGSKLQLNSVAGVGYTADGDSQKLLQEIDEKLKDLLPSDDFTEICSTPSLLGDRRDSFDPEAFDLGERLLQDTKAARSQQQRLRDIDQELASLQDQVDLEIASPSLTKAQLDSLLQRCSEASDRTITEITSPRLQPVQSNRSNPASPRSSSQLSPRGGGGGGGESPPHERLSDDTLQQLLWEAKTSLGMLALENAGGGSSQASSRTATITPSAAGSVSDRDQLLALSLGDSPRSEMSMNTSRSLVSHDMIQQLLRNPRATMLQSRQQMTFDPDGTEDREGVEDDQLNASLER